MKKKNIFKVSSIVAFFGAIAMGLTSCGFAYSYKSYSDTYSSKIVTNITEKEGDADNKYNTDYFYKTFLDTETTNAETKVTTRNFVRYIYKLDDGFRTQKGTYSDGTYSVTEDCLYDIKRSSLEEDAGETVYYLTKYTLNYESKKYASVSEKVILDDAGTYEHPLYDELYADAGLVKTVKADYYKELLALGDIKAISEKDFRSMSGNPLTGFTLSYNTAAGEVVTANLSKTAKFDISMSSISNLFSVNTLFITEATIGPTLPVKYIYDLHAIYVKDNPDSVFTKEIKDLKKPDDSMIDTTVAE